MSGRKQNYGSMPQPGETDPLISKSTPKPTSGGAVLDALRKTILLLDGPRLVVDSKLRTEAPFQYRRQHASGHATIPSDEMKRTHRPADEIKAAPTPIVIKAPPSTRQQTLMQLFFGYHPDSGVTSPLDALLANGSAAAPTRPRGPS